MLAYQVPERLRTCAPADTSANWGISHADTFTLHAQRHSSWHRAQPHVDRPMTGRLWRRSPVLGTLGMQHVWSLLVLTASPCTTCKTRQHVHAVESKVQHPGNIGTQTCTCTGAGCHGREMKHYLGQPGEPRHMCRCSPRPRPQCNDHGDTQPW